MDAFSKRSTSLTKNKENTKPAVESKPFIKRQINKPISSSSASLHSNNKVKEDTSSNPKNKPKDVEAANSKIEHAKPSKGTSDKVSKKRQTLSQLFLTEQAVRQRKLVAEAKPPTVPSKPALGKYKGRIVQSKIGFIWKTGSIEGGMEQKALHVENQKTRSKSFANVQGCGILKPQIQLARSKSVSDRRPQKSNHRATTRLIASDTADSARNIVSSLPSSHKSSAICKVKGTENLKNKMPVTTDKVIKRNGYSTLSQYRVSTEAPEERRAKLADWLASKGKTLKRPPVSFLPPKKSKAVSKPEAQSANTMGNSLLVTEIELKLQSDLQSVQEGCLPLLKDIPELGQQISSHLILNTTLDLLDNSDMDLPVDPEIKMNDVVVNLCDALEAMTTESDKEESLPLKLKDESSEEIMTPNIPEMFEKEDLAEDVLKCSEKVEVRSDSEEGCLEEDDIDLRKTPELEDASVVKYNVKTTPYLQSVKRTIEGDTNTGGSRQKSTIKDLKFLTPVRRSTRIQRQSSRMPEMLADHDPCISSLAELVKLDEDSNAYIYRRNPVLMGDLPDDPRDLRKILN